MKKFSTIALAGAMLFATCNTPVKANPDPSVVTSSITDVGIDNFTFYGLCTAVGLAVVAWVLHKTKPSK